MRTTCGAEWDCKRKSKNEPKFLSLFNEHLILMPNPSFLSPFFFWFWNKFPCYGWFCTFRYSWCQERCVRHHKRSNDFIAFRRFIPFHSFIFDQKKKIDFTQTKKTKTRWTKRKTRNKRRRRRKERRKGRKRRKGWLKNKKTDIGVFFVFWCWLINDYYWLRFWCDWNVLRTIFYFFWDLLLLLLWNLKWCSSSFHFKNTKLNKKNGDITCFRCVRFRNCCNGFLSEASGEIF